MCDALRAGSKPPTKPMINEKIIPLYTISKDRVKRKASSEKVWKFTVEIVINCIKEAKRSPDNPPKKPRRRDSKRKAERISLLRKPRARSVPISAIRLATAEYMVIIAPMIAPREKMIVREVPKIRRNFAII
jgi:hypothetical protein